MKRWLIATVALLASATCSKREAPGRYLTKGEGQAAAAPAPPQVLEAMQQAGGEGESGNALGDSAGSADKPMAAPGGLKLQGTGSGGGGVGTHGLARATRRPAPAKGPSAAGTKLFALEADGELADKDELKKAEESEKKANRDDGLGWRAKLKEKGAAAASVRATGESAAVGSVERKPDAPRSETVAMGAQASGKDGKALEMVLGDDATAKPAEPASPPPDHPGDACTRDPAPPRPLPKRCHLAPNYFAGAAAWQRRLSALAELPPELARLAASTPGGADLQPPETTALSVSARLDRDHIAAPGLVWLRIALRSTDRWGMRRPPFDLAVAVGPQLARRGDDACKHLEAIAGYLEPQDRLTVLVGAGQDQYDGIGGSEAIQRVRALCSSVPAIGQSSLGDQHRAARQLLGVHAAAQHRVAGTRAVVLVGAANDLEDGDLQQTVTEALAEPTLSSVVLAEPTATDTAWRLAELGHGLVALGPPGAETAGARSLWQAWGRVVARLVRVDIRLAGSAVAHRVLGSRVLDDQETARVRRQERAVDANLARVAGVQRDRDNDGEGMTMLIPAFLGSDEHVIDLLVHVEGAGPVADVVVDYKDLVRMSNQKAMARAALHDLPTPGGRVAAPPEQLTADDWRAIEQFREQVRHGDSVSVQNRVRSWTQAGGPAGFVALAQAVAPLVGPVERRAALLAAIETWTAHARGCHVAVGR